MNRIGRNKRGFTLVELLVSMALMAMLMTAAALALEAAHSSHAYNSEKTDLTCRARGVLDRVARDVRLSMSFDVPDAQTVDITMPDGTIHTYAWDGVVGGDVWYTLTDGEATTSTLLTDKVKAFVVGDVSPACNVKILLVGTLASSEGNVTSTPRKAVY